jgi:hypothetical protein
MAYFYFEAQWKQFGKLNHGKSWKIRWVARIRLAG